MTAAILGTTLLLLALLALLLNLNLYSPWRWQVKAVAIFISFGLIVVVYLTSNNWLGWPTDQALPEDGFVVLAAHIVEPNKSTGSAGSIYLWIQHKSPTSISEVEEVPPRAYRLAYSKPLHQATLKLIYRLAQGKQQGGRTTGKDGRSVEFYDLTRRLPPKRGQ